MRFWFDAFYVDERLRTLQEGGRDTPLRPKHVQVLALLVRNRPSVISNTAILDEVWGGENAQEGYVTTAINEIRNVLGDQRKSPRYIRTVHGEGYAFIFSNVRSVPDEHIEPGLTPSGLKAKHAFSIWEILDDEGTVRRTQRIEGFRVGDGISLEVLEGKTGMWTPGGDKKIPPEFSLLTSFPKSVRYEAKDVLGDGRYRWQLIFGEPLNSQDPPLDYMITETYSRAILMTNEAAAAAYAGDPFKHEYCAWDANLPVESITITVSFPERLRLEFSPGVFWGASEWFFHTAELERVRHGFSATNHNAAFSIEPPSVGFRYFISWRFND
ncbi:MAG TPA: winged helix-turn-helix domain-containing protein [Vicinamibacterales bacterium]|nr:winged helix-turn-helix domain-containing protein [Vicinamibacterales bacterium]